MQDVLSAQPRDKSLSPFIQRCLEAARVPDAVPSGDFYPWIIDRQKPTRAGDRARMGHDGKLTLLGRWTMGTLHLLHGEIVMEDSNQELLRHAPAWLAARGHVLVTGLGLGCVVRGLLSCPLVERVTVIEKCAIILDAVGPSFGGCDRVDLIHADALKWQPPSGVRYDMAWHDIWSDHDAEEPHLQVLHSRLLMSFRPNANIQGAWQFPRELKRLSRRAGLNYLERA